MKIIDDKKTNPLICFTFEDLKPFLKEKIVEAGYGDHPINAVQISIDKGHQTGDDRHLTWNTTKFEIVVMLSNSKGVVV